MKYLRLSLPSQQWLVHGLAAIFPPNSLLFPNREGFKMLLLLLSLHEDLYERSAHLKMAPRRYWNMWMWRLKHLKGTHSSFFLVSCWHRVNRGRCQCLSLCFNNCECETTGYILGDFGNNFLLRLLQKKPERKKSDISSFNRDPVTSPACFWWPKQVF